MTKALNPASSRLDRLIGDGWSILPFKQLELPYKLAVAYYMAVDGEAWCDVLPPWRGRATSAQVRQTLLDHMHAFDAAYGDVPFGIVMLPSQAVRDAIMESPDLSEDHQTWESYHAWYSKSGQIPNHPKDGRWPVVLADFEDELLEDGYHRLHCYLRRGDETIPAYFYPRPRHLARMGSD